MLLHLLWMPPPTVRRDNKLIQGAIFISSSFLKFCTFSNIVSQAICMVALLCFFKTVFIKIFFISFKNYFIRDVSFSSRTDLIEHWVTVWIDHKRFVLFVYFPLFYLYLSRILFVYIKCRGCYFERKGIKLHKLILFLSNQGLFKLGLLSLGRKPSFCYCRGNIVQENE